MFSSIPCTFRSGYTLTKCVAGELHGLPLLLLLCQRSSGHRFGELAITRRRPVIFHIRAPGMSVRIHPNLYRPVRARVTVPRRYITVSSSNCHKMATTPSSLWSAWQRWRDGQVQSNLPSVAERVAKNRKATQGNGYCSSLLNALTSSCLKARPLFRRNDYHRRSECRLTSPDSLRAARHRTNLTRPSVRGVVSV